MRTSIERAIVVGALRLTCALSSRAAGQSPQPPATARLLGVFDQLSGAPLEGVQVRDGFSGAYSLTSASGVVQLSYVTFRGEAALVRLMKLGYEPKTIFLQRSDTMPITEILSRVTRLDAVVTTARYRLDRDDGQRSGFARRCEFHTVTCFSDSVLATSASSNMADVIMKAPGVMLGACGSDPTRNSQCGKAAMRSSVIPPAYCEPSIFVDGFWWNPHTGGAIDMHPNTAPSAPFTPGNVTGVEVYATSAPRPLRFEGDPFCGAIVVWTK